MGFLMEDQCGSHLGGSRVGFYGPDWIHFARRSETLLTLAFRRNRTIQTYPESFWHGPSCGNCSNFQKVQIFPRKTQEKLWENRSKCETKQALTVTALEEDNMESREIEDRCDLGASLESGPLVWRNGRLTAKRGKRVF